MDDNSRSPDICPWDPGEVCKAANGACLPPRKRLLAGLKQNGWLSSSPPYFQRYSGVSCATEELKLEVDLRATKRECSGDSFSSEPNPTCKQGECKAVEKLVPIKSKRARNRRKSLSVLADCNNCVKNLQQPEIFKSCSGDEIQEKVRAHKHSILNPLLSSNREKERVPSYKEMVDAARAAAAIAAKAAAEAKAIALEKAAAAAKAAAIARAALEAVAREAEDEVLECQPNRHVWDLDEENRIHKELKRKFGSGPKVIPLSPLLLTEGVNDSLEKKKENKRTPNGRGSFDERMDDEKTQAGQGSTIASHPVDIGDVLDGNTEEKCVHSGQNSIVALATASVDTPFHKHEEAEQTQCSKIHAIACPMPPPFDDAKLARQLHRAMNSSLRISRSRACLELSRKSETSPSSTEGCTQIRDRQAGGCSLSLEKKQIHREKLRDSRASNGKTDIKVKSMIAINEALNMLQKTKVTQYRVFGDTVSSFAASNEYTDTFCHKEDDCMPGVPNHASESLTNCTEDGGTCDADGSHKFSLNLKGNSDHFSSYAHDSGTVGRVDESRANKGSQIRRKLKLRRRQRTTGSILVSSQSWDGNRVNELPSLWAENQSDAPSNLATEQTGSHFETSDGQDHKGRDENRMTVSRSGSFAGGDVNEMPTIKTIQENLFHSTSSRATHKISLVSLHGERQKRGQKILQMDYLRGI